MTHDELRLMAFRLLKNGKGYEIPPCAIVTSEIPGAAGEFPDALGWHVHGTSILIECKASRADYLADRKKMCRRGPGLGEYRYYLTPPGVIKPDDDLHGWGHLVAHHCKHLTKIQRVTESERHKTEGKEKGVLIQAMRMSGKVNHKIGQAFIYFKPWNGKDPRIPEEIPDEPCPPANIPA